MLDEALGVVAGIAEHDMVPIAADAVAGAVVVRVAICSIRNGCVIITNRRKNDWAIRRTFNTQDSVHIKRDIDVVVCVVVKLDHHVRTYCQTGARCNGDGVVKVVDHVGIAPDAVVRDRAAEHVETVDAVVLKR